MKTTIKNRWHKLVLLSLFISIIGSYGSNAQPPDHYITFQQAKTYIYEFITRADNLQECATRYSLGGYISKNFLETGINNVIKFYPCYDVDFLIFHDDVFLSYMYDSVDALDRYQCRLSINDQLKQSSDDFSYSGSDYTMAEVDTFLSNQEDGSLNNDTPVRHDGKNVNKYSFRMMQEFLADGITPNLIQCGSIWVREIDDLVNQTDNNGQPLIGFRFFFGYDPTRKNSIRLIFIGVDSNGKNFITNSAGTDAIILERSWPPD